MDFQLNYWALLVADLDIPHRRIMVFTRCLWESLMRENGFRRES
jgi:hypothetical protein